MNLTKDKLQSDASVVNVEDTRPLWLSDDGSDNSCDDSSDNSCDDSSDNSSYDGSDNSHTIDLKTRRHWGFVFTHASRSSTSILVALRWLRIIPKVYLNDDFVGTSWIVREMILWLKVCVGTIIIQETTTIGKEQTVDTQPQDELVAWVESVYAEVERR